MKIPEPNRPFMEAFKRWEEERNKPFTPLGSAGEELQRLIRNTPHGDHNGIRVTPISIFFAISEGFDRIILPGTGKKPTDWYVLIYLNLHIYMDRNNDREKVEFYGIGNDASRSPRKIRNMKNEILTLQDYDNLSSIIRLTSSALRSQK